MHGVYFQLETLHPPSLVVKRLYEPVARLLLLHWCDLKFKGIIEEMMIDCQQEQCLLLAPVSIYSVYTTMGKYFKLINT